MVNRVAQTIGIKIDFKKKKVVIGKLEFKKSCETHISVYDLWASADEPFDRLHQQLKVFADVHHFDVKHLHQLMAHTPVIRVIHFVNELRIARYETVALRKLYVTANACVLSGSTLKKTTEYTAYLAKLLPSEVGTTISSKDRDRFKYILPPQQELETYSLEMIDEEIRVCEQSRGKYKQANLAILRDYRQRIKQEANYDREAKKEPRKTDLDIIREELKAIKKEK